ncbi:MAG: YceI family protein [Dokdonella sp.]
MFDSVVLTRLHNAMLVALASLLLTTATASHASELQRYRFDPTHSQIVFFVSHLGFSQAIGRLRLGPGHFSFDEEDWSRSTVDVAVNLDSLDMGDAKWTDAVKAGQLLDVARYPQARFMSRTVEKVGGNKGVIHGELALHGKTVPLDLAVTFNKAARDPYTFKDKVGFSASTTLQRGEFGIKRYQGVIGEAVEVRIEVEGIPDNRIGNQ